MKKSMSFADDRLFLRVRLNYYVPFLLLVLCRLFQNIDTYYKLVNNLEGCFPIVNITVSITKTFFLIQFKFEPALVLFN